VLCDHEGVGDRLVAFVLGGGGVLGAAEVGMLRALLRYGIKPDLIVGTSVGAINGVFVAADPREAVTDRLAALWSSVEARKVYGDSTTRQLARVVRGRPHLHSPRPLREMLYRELGAWANFADLPIRFQCCAASIERAAEHWFDRGPVIEAVLASSAVPALLPPIAIGDEHFIDGGIVNSIPIGRAVQLGAGTVFVLQVGRVDRPLAAPRTMFGVARVAFEISRRHRYARELADIPSNVDVHVLPTGRGSERDDSPLAYRDLAAAGRRIARAEEASAQYLRERLG
jgi:NTE family protein